MTEAYLSNHLSTPARTGQSVGGNNTIVKVLLCSYLHAPLHLFHWAPTAWLDAFHGSCKLSHPEAALAPWSRKCRTGSQLGSWQMQQ